MVVFENTKSGAPYEARLADVLIATMDKYLRDVRPLLLERSGRWKTAVGNAVWVSADGSPMTQEALAGRIKLRTKTAFGKPISPHRFRDAAATFLSIADPAKVRMAAPLLGHRSLTMTEKHYIQGDGLQRQRTYLDVVLKRYGHE
jgi:site-specific recombinase XerD